MKGSKRETRSRELTRIVVSAYEKHEIVSSDESRWLLKQRYADGNGFTSAYWAEVVALHWGGLLVTGDVESVLFRYGPSGAPEKLVSWMGSRVSADDSYFKQKAAIGGGGLGTTESWEVDVAIEDIREMIGDDGCYEELREELEEIASTCLHETRETIYERLYEAGVEGEDLGRVGAVTASHLYFAHACLQRLLVLIEEKNIAESVSQAQSA